MDAVRYVGPDRDGLTFGVQGRPLAHTASYAHVMWTEGACEGQVGLHPWEDLSVVSTAITASLDESLEFGSLESLAGIQEAYSETGSEGVVSHLTSVGYLAPYAVHAEEAMQRVAGVLQDDPVLRRLTAVMDPDEADEVYRLAARTLFTDLGDF